MGRNETINKELLAALKGILAVANVRIDDPRCEAFDAAREAVAKAEAAIAQAAEDKRYEKYDYYWKVIK